MQAIRIAQTGGPEVLTVAEVPQPVPCAGEALIAIEAIGVNFIDIYFREGALSLAAAVHARARGFWDRRFGGS